MALKVWCVSYYTGLGYSDSSELFLTESEAKIFAENRIAGGCKDVKYFETTDIWGFTARHFTDKIINIIANRLGEDGNCVHLYESDASEESLEEELERTAAEAGIKDFSCDIWNVFDSTGIDIYALSCAWTYRGELKHYTDTLEVF